MGSYSYEIEGFASLYFENKEDLNKALEAIKAAKNSYNFDLDLEDSVLDAENPEDLRLCLYYVDTMDIDYTFVPYVPATRYDPPEGGYAEIEGGLLTYDDIKDNLKSLMNEANIKNLVVDYDFDNINLPDEESIQEQICDFKHNNDFFDDYDDCYRD